MMTMFAEPLVARATGVAKRILAAKRREVCERGPDWQLSERAVVEYTREGLEKICGALRLDVALVLEAGAREVAEGPSGATAAEIEASAGRDEASGADEKSAEFCRRAPVAELVAEAVEVLPAPPELEWLVVTRLVLNPTVVMARVHDAGEEMAVKVRSNLHWLPGCWMQGRRVGPRMYIHEGRAPRWKGDRYGFGRPEELSLKEELPCR